MSNIVQRINSSNWFNNRINNINDIHIYSTSKIKCLKKIIYGKGKMMQKYEYIISLYERKEFVKLQLYNERLSKEMSNFWEGSYGKYLQLIIFSRFLINYNNYNQQLRNKLFCESIKYMKADHEIGRLIHNYMVNIHTKN